MRHMCPNSVASSHEKIGFDLGTVTEHPRELDTYLKITKFLMSELYSVWRAAARAPPPIVWIDIQLCVSAEFSFIQV